jgi:hypothetical protein
MPDEPLFDKFGQPIVKKKPKPKAAIKQTGKPVKMAKPAGSTKLKKDLPDSAAARRAGYTR